MATHQGTDKSGSRPHSGTSRESLILARRVPNNSQINPLAATSNEAMSPGAFQGPVVLGSDSFRRTRPPKRGGQMKLKFRAYWPLPAPYRRVLQKPAAPAERCGRLGPYRSAGAWQRACCPWVSPDRQFLPGCAAILAAWKQNLFAPLRRQAEPHLACSACGGLGSPEELSKTFPKPPTSSQPRFGWRRRFDRRYHFGTPGVLQMPCQLFREVAKNSAAEAREGHFMFVLA